MRRPGSWFVSEGAPRHAGHVVVPQRQGFRQRSAFVHEVPVRPGPFVVGLGAHPEAYDPRPRQPLPGTPVQPSYFLGRVEEVDDSGTVYGRLWETPNGRELLVALGKSDAEWVGTADPVPGDLLRVWTWTELPSGEEHIRASAERRQLSDQDRQNITEMLTRLS